MSRQVWIRQSKPMDGELTTNNDKQHNHLAHEAWPMWFQVSKVKLTCNTSYKTEYIETYLVKFFQISFNMVPAIVIISNIMLL